VKKENRITEAEIASLVDHFYVKVREDKEIVLFSIRRVQNRNAHLALLKDFWSTVLPCNRSL
jgi:hemoglobin